MRLRNSRWREFLKVPADGSDGVRTASGATAFNGKRSLRVNMGCGVGRVRLPMDGWYIRAI